MRATPSWGALLLVALVGCIDSAEAAIYGGGGGSSTDCLAVFDAAVNDPPSRPRKVRCADGDACDEDGTVNGVCEFSVAVCANSTFDPGECSLVGVQDIVVDHAIDQNDPLFDPEFQALQSLIDGQIEPPTSDPDSCTSPSAIRVPIRGPLGGGACKKGQKRLRLETESVILQGSKIDRDKLILICDPTPGCSPQTIFTGTFDRIQRQIFNPSCAIGGCHDSNTMTGGLLLEEGSAYAQIVDVDPSNFAALGLGWKRIDGANANPATSFLFHKVTGDLGPGLGERMPFGGAKLGNYLIDILELWIEAGAPQAGWVPGTD